MYGRCGALASARQMFDEMSQTQVFDLVSWTSIVSAYMHNGDSNNAIGLFRTMCASGCDDIKPDAFSLANVLPAFVSMGDWLRGKQLHGFAMRSGLFEDVFVANSLVDMYAKCGMMEEADKVFKQVNKKNVVTWNSMVTGYSQLGRFEETLALFKKMRTEKIDFDVVSWNAVIAGYAQRERGYEALDVFRQMQVAGVKPDEVTLLSLLSGCASVGALCQGKEAHCYAIKSFLKFDRSDPRDELSVMNTIIDMYAKCKSIIVARAIFDSIAPKDRDVVTWNAMIGGYAQHGEGNGALELFSRMLKQDQSLKPNAYTVAYALTASGRLAAVRSGKQIHAYALRNQFSSDVVVVANCLINMYSKCGDNNVARIVFNNMLHRDAVSWNILMTGYGMHGHGEEALKVFDEMIKEGLAPSSVTFLVVLYACSHSGMVDEGIKYFDTMSAKYGITPGQEHYCSMVDLFGRAGRLDEATNLINGMPMEPDPAVWIALLGGCRKYANVEIGEFAANKLMQLESRESGAYTLLSNIYANAKRWDDMSRVLSLMKHSGIRKRPACSWVQDKKGTATFFAGDRAHPQSKQIHEILRELIRRIEVLGYVPETSFALHDVDDKEKDNLLIDHSEKIALAYGILTSAPGAPIRIIKNLRTCGDCHSAFTYISRIIDHEIILRDSSRFHHFKKGSCSCRGYW
ncbi:Pentatricopeptide repeat-containing protein At5g16860 [Euphorbia peplus]|nr:Pentatricopeptide repeat-containing protein At5g16860 [Euphorbia peplus]